MAAANLRHIGAFEAKGNPRPFADDVVPTAFGNLRQPELLKRLVDARSPAPVKAGVLAVMADALANWRQAADASEHAISDVLALLRAEVNA